MKLYFGIVESRDSDPMMMGRLKVRVIGVHSDDRVLLPTADLPWAIPMLPVTSAAVNGIGSSPTGPVEGTMVIVTFLDGTDCQKPMVIGTLGGVPTEASNGLPFSDPNQKYPKQEFLNEPDFNRLSRNQSIDKTIVKHKEDTIDANIKLGSTDPELGPQVWSQPVPPYGARYPFNHVFESESGHILEFDDTEGSERIQLYHKTGTYTEIDANGTQVNKIVGNGYEILANDKYVHIKGQCVINIDGDSTVYVEGNSNIQVFGDLNTSVNGNVNVASQKNITLQAAESVQLSAKDIIFEAETLSVNTGNQINILAGANISIDSTENVYQQSKTATPKSLNYETWSVFSRDALMMFPDAPSNIANQVASLDDIESLEQAQAMGIDINSPAIQAMIQAAKDSGEVLNIDNVKTQTVNTTCNNLVISPDTQLSPKFKLRDLCKATGGIVVSNMGLSREQIACNLKRLAENCLEPIKAQFPGMRVESGFRRNSGGSQHNIGQAADMHFYENGKRVSRLRLFEIAEWIAKNITYDQLILEFSAVSPGWIHVSFKESGNRSLSSNTKILTTFTGTVPYRKGLIKPA